MPSVWRQYAGLHDRFGQLFYKQWHAVGVGHDVPEDLCGQRFAAGHLRDHRLHVGRGQALQGQGREVGPQSPGRLKVRSIGHHGQDRRGGPLGRSGAEELQGRGIGPVQIFENEEDRLPFCQL